MMKIAIIGTGVYSTSLTYLLQKQKENDIHLWTEQPKLVEIFQKSKKFNFLPKKIKYDSNVYISTSFEDTLKDASLIFILVGSKYFQSTLEQIKPYYKKNTPILVGTKGMDLEKCDFFSNITRKYLKCNSYSFFAGPTFAKELIMDFPVYFTFAGSNKIGYRKIKEIFPSNVTTEFISDLYGLEILATLKNIYAIGSGILKGLKVTDGVYYTYMSKIIREANDIIQKVYGSSSTLLTYGGLGDLLMTSNCTTSRNFTFGTLIGKNTKQEEIEKYKQENTIEGLENLKHIPLFFKKMKVKNSIISQIYQIVFEQDEPKKLYEVQQEEKIDTF